MSALLILRLVLLGLIALFLLSALAVHFRSRVRLKLGRQLASHATVFAPYNLLMYAFSAVPAGAFPERKRFTEVEIGRASCRERVKMLVVVGSLRRTSSR